MKIPLAFAIAAALLVAAPVLAQQESPGKRAAVRGMQMYHEVTGQGDRWSCCTALT